MVTRRGPGGDVGEHPFHQAVERRDRPQLRRPGPRVPAVRHPRPHFGRPGRDHRGPRVLHRVVPPVRIRPGRLRRAFHRQAGPAAQAPRGESRHLPGPPPAGPAPGRGGPAARARDPRVGGRRRKSGVGGARPPAHPAPRAGHHRRQLPPVRAVRRPVPRGRGEVRPRRGRTEALGQLPRLRGGHPSRGHRDLAPVLQVRLAGQPPPAGPGGADAAQRLRGAVHPGRRVLPRQPAGGDRQDHRPVGTVPPRPDHHPARLRRRTAEADADRDRAARHGGGARGAQGDRLPAGVAGQGGIPVSAPLRGVAVVGPTGPVSKTKALTELVISSLAARTEISAEIIEIHALNPGLGAAIARGQLDDPAEAAIRAAETADLLIAATPVFRGSYTGLFKHFFDFVDQYALAGKPVLLAATGGSDRHALVIDQALRPLFGFFQAWTAPMGVYLSSGDFAGTTVLNPEAYERIEVAVDDVVPVAHLLAAARTETATPA